MEKELTLKLDSDSQVIIRRIVQKKLDNSMWILKNKKPEDISDIRLLRERITIYQKLLTQLGFESMPDEISEEDAE